MLEDPPGGLCNNDCGPVQAGWGEGDADWPHSGCSEDSADVIYSWMWVWRKKEGRIAGFLPGFSLPRCGGLGVVGRRVWEEDQRFGFRHMGFDMPSRLSSLKFRGRSTREVMSLEAIITKLVFQAGKGNYEQRRQSPDPSMFGCQGDTGQQA